MKFQGFQHLYQQFRASNPRLVDTLDRIHDYLQTLSGEVEAIPDVTQLTAGPLTLICNGSFGIINLPLDIQLAATGGIQPYTFDIIAGSLPSGMTLDATTGVISGTPDTVDTYTFTAQVTDDTGTTTTVDCVVVISGFDFAPNIVNATVNVTFQIWSAVSVPVFSGVMTLPADLGTLYVIVVYYVDPTTKDVIPIARYDSGFVAGGTLNYSGWDSQIRQTNADQTGKQLKFVVYNPSFTPTAAPFTVSGVTIPGATISLVVGREIPGTVKVDPVTRLNTTSIGTVGTFSTHPLFATLWLSSDNGVTYRWMRWEEIDTVGQEIVVDRVKPVQTETWKVALAVGAIPGDPSVFIPVASLPAGTVISAGFSVGHLVAPAANLIHALNFSAPPLTGNFPYNNVDVDGNQFWLIADINYDDTDAAAAVEPFVVTLTFQDLDLNHNPIGPEHIYGSQVVSIGGAVQHVGSLQGPYGTVADPPRTGSISYVRGRVYVGNRGNGDTNAFQDTFTNTLQSNIGGGLDHKDVLVAVNGLVPTGAIPGARVSGAVSQALNAQSVLGSGVIGRVANANNADFVPGAGVVGTVNVGGTALTTLITIKNATDTLVGWWGSAVVTGLGVRWGVYAQNAWFGIGGPGPNGANIWLDDAGNGHFSGSLEAGISISTPTIVGGVYTSTSQATPWSSLITYSVGNLVSFSGLVWQSTINNNLNHAPGTGGWTVVATVTDFLQITAGLITLVHNGGLNISNISGLQISSDTIKANQQFQLGFFQIVNAAAQWVGSDVLVPGRRVSCNNLVVGPGGITYNNEPGLTTGAFAFLKPDLSTGFLRWTQGGLVAKTNF